MRARSSNRLLSVSKKSRLERLPAVHARMRTWMRSRSTTVHVISHDYSCPVHDTLPIAAMLLLPHRYARLMLDCMLGRLVTITYYLYRPVVSELSIALMYLHSHSICYSSIE